MSAAIESAVLRFDRFEETSRQCAAEIDYVVHHALTQIRQQILEEEQDSLKVLGCVFTTLQREVREHQTFIEEHPKRYSEADQEAWSEAIREELVNFWARIEAYALVGRWAVCAEVDRVEREANGEPVSCNPPLWKGVD